MLVWELLDFWLPNFRAFTVSAESYGDQVYLRSSTLLRPSFCWNEADDQHREPKIDKQIIKMIKCTLGPTTFNLNPPAPTALWSKGKIMIQFFFVNLLSRCFGKEENPCPPSLAPRSCLSHQLRAEELLQHSDLRNYRMAIKTTPI